MKASWLPERFLDSSTPQPEAFTYLRHQIVSSHNLDQPPWTAHLASAEASTSRSRAVNGANRSGERRGGQLPGDPRAFLQDLPRRLALLLLTLGGEPGGELLGEQLPVPDRRAGDEASASRAPITAPSAYAATADVALAGSAATDVAIVMAAALASARARSYSLRCTCRSARARAHGCVTCRDKR
ncbi:hypothetical protein AB0A95_20670 [Micromonospora sp. NPDC049230]|uniref:hypothetical protein n=1 Tax=Micromonospora sp. NPDC049230 TaxID=3155502 RepID=UPI0033DDA2F6